MLKSAWTDQAFHGGSDCLQVFGGHGYVREWGIEQVVRDSRVAMIYEGTNEIQAQDLLFRKVLPDRGAVLGLVLDRLDAELATLSAAGSTTHQSAVLAREGVQRTRELLATLGTASPAQTQNLYPVAGDFLRLTTLTLMAWALTRLAAASQGQHAVALAAFHRWVWPEHTMRLGMVRAALAA